MRFLSKLVSILTFNKSILNYKITHASICHPVPEKIKNFKQFLIKRHVVWSQNISLLLLKFYTSGKSVVHAL